MSRVRIEEVLVALSLRPAGWILEQSVLPDAPAAERTSSTKGTL